LAGFRVARVFQRQLGFLVYFEITIKGSFFALNVTKLAAWIKLSQACLPVSVGCLHVSLLSFAKLYFIVVFGVDLQISDKSLIDLIRRKVKLNHPYAGVFLKRDDEYESYFPMVVNIS